MYYARGATRKGSFSGRTPASPGAWVADPTFTVDPPATGPSGDGSRSTGRSVTVDDRAQRERTQRAGTEERGNGGPPVAVREKVALRLPAAGSRALGAGRYAFGSEPEGGRLVEEEEVVRVLLVEDHVIFRQLFASVFESEPDFEVVAQAGSLVEAREALKDLGEGAGGVDVAVVDLNLPDGEGTDLIGDLLLLREGSSSPGGAVALVLTASLDLGTYGRAVEAGAAGVLHKSASIEEVMGAIRRLAAGEALLSQKEVVELLRVADRERTRGREARKAFEQLTDRERDVLFALAEGLNDKEIAGRLRVRPGTARSYVASMLGKLGAHSRLQALVFAARHGFVQIGPADDPP